MEYRKLGKIDVSVIGLGTLRTFDVTSEEDISVRRQIVENCISNQINLIDCASAYGNTRLGVDPVWWTHGELVSLIQ